MNEVLNEDITGLAAMAGITLTPEQEALLISGLRTGSDGKRAQFQVAVPEDQDGVILIREMAGLFLLGERILHVSAGNGRSAAQARKMTETVIGRPDLARRISYVSRVNGGELISTWDGEIRFLTQGRGKGCVADLIVLGSGTDRGSRAFAALVPCVMSRPDPQIWMAGS